ncbi:hypothetical protein Celaphus_00007639, partial [Cervus elaphus hippelaphus]
VWSTFLRPELVRRALEKSLKDLQLEYVDLYIIHHPVALVPGEAILPTDENGKPIFDSVNLCHTWEALEKCKDAGLTKSIGVSNFNHKQLEKILNKPGLKYKPVCNQNLLLTLEPDVCLSLPPVHPTFVNRGFYTAEPVSGP